MGWFHHEGSEVIGAFTLSLRGGSGARDAAIHRVPRRADGFGGSVAEVQWIATPQEARDEKRELRDGAVRLLRVSGSPRAFSPRDEKSGIITIERVKRLRLHSLCHCEEGAKRPTRQSIVPRRTRTELSVRLLRARGSLRAYTLAMTRLRRKR